VTAFVAGSRCTAAGHAAPTWWAVSVTVIATAILVCLVFIAEGYPPSEQRPGRVVVGRALQILGVALVLTGSVLALFAGTDGCGHVSGTVGRLSAWFAFGGLPLIMLGSTIRTSTEWIAFGAIVVADFWLFLLLCIGSVYHRAALLVMLGTHGLCIGVASWWSRRTRGGDRTTKAKAAEAGRVLAGGWLALVLLGIASTTDHDASLTPDTTFVSVLVITAIGVVMGTGYTRYVEAVETPRCQQPPEPDGLARLWRRLRRRAAASPHGGDNHRATTE
jgi:hypothetical protein